MAGRFARAHGESLTGAADWPSIARKAVPSVCQKQNPRMRGFYMRLAWSSRSGQCSLFEGSPRHCTRPLLYTTAASINSRRSTKKVDPT